MLKRTTMLQQACKEDPCISRDKRQHYLAERSGVITTVKVMEIERNYPYVEEQKLTRVFQPNGSWQAGKS